MTLGELTEGIADAAVSTLDRAALGEFSSMAEAEQYYSDRIQMLGQTDPSSTDSSNPLSSLLSPLTGNVVSSLSSQAMNTIQPALLSIFAQYTPTFAAMTGAVVALSLLFGVYIAKETMLHISGRRGS
jgi:hypothetical protein